MLKLGLMKELYFAYPSITKTAHEMLQQVSAFTGRKKFPFSANGSALLVLDMQRYFLEPASHAYVPSAQAIVPNLRKLVDSYHQSQKPIIFTRHLNTPQNAGMMSSWWRNLIGVDDPFSEIIDGLDVSKGILMEKTQYDAFYHTDLQTLLDENSIRRIVICGVMTHLCCETTARSAFMRGFEVYFCVDGTATYSREHHLASLLNLSHGFATPLLVDKVIEAVRGHND